MEKKIKVNEKNLIKALRATAKAHNVKFENWLEDGQVGIKSESIPVVADVKSIVGAFCNNLNAHGLVEVGYGYTTIFIDSCMYDFKKEMSSIDVMQLEMALPADTKIKWEMAA